MLAVTVAKRLGKFRLDVSLTVEEGTTLVVVGESGSGKSTLLRLLAGLDDPDSGTIVLDGTVYADRATGARVSPWQRAIGFVPQDYALFPHLTVEENVAFGLQAAGTDAGETRRRVARFLERLGVADLAMAHPRALSGGQQQRVALARALVLEPRLLLLDEPMSALDLNTRRSIRSTLRGLLEALPCMTVYVTHAPAEALILGDRIAALEDGRVTQSGSRDDFLRRPQSQYVAAFFGVNLFRGPVVDRAAIGGDGLVCVATEQGAVWGMASDQNRAEAALTVVPGAITLHRACPAASPTMTIRQGRIVEIAAEPPRGERMRVTIDAGAPLVADLARGTVAALELREGEMVWAAFEARDAVDGG